MTSMELTDPVQRESMRVLRSNLLSALRNLDNPIVLVTSANEGEGKTSTCVPLARSFADGGFDVVLVDLDLRHPDAHNYLGLPNEPGASDVLQGRVGLDEALQRLSQPSGGGLAFLPTGSPVENATELLDTVRTVSLLNSLAKRADIVLVDTPPVLPVADTLVVGRLAAGAVLVVEARRTAVPAIQRAKDMLMRNQTRVLGLVLNRLRSQDDMFTYGYAMVEHFPDKASAPSPNGQEDVTSQ
ncbi:MAG: CpsD/CapB family tyrosine-protein kinase [Acidimicrobiales bacterium]|nr:CpsD/CapB family tyrosine-protein kinase [Acidimicrobiales bacterium]